MEEDIIYVCTENFCIQRVDDEGFEVENEAFWVHKGTTWKLIDGYEKWDEYNLHDLDEFAYISINKASLDEYFSKREDLY